MQCKIDLPGAIEQHKLIQKDIFNSYKYSSKYCFLTNYSRIVCKVAKKSNFCHLIKKEKSPQNNTRYEKQKISVLFFIDIKQLKYFKMETIS